MDHDQHPDAALIDGLGGPTATAKRLDILDEPGAVQRVSNWKRRGIPARVRLDHAEVFAEAAAAATAQPAPAQEGA
ncbi:hypothetical protein BBB39_15375 [Bordetella trematum]|uniref:Phage protein n=1 Tax=Bordetella trematum TaxID=123899 RepID=A0A157S718_9BORD|nr:hypothetical protein BBB39_15375 [Bordetella trematum]SAI36870.1 phage protein [Bordetella trematum]SAI66218.1 phage protein [Bordetella trematum]SUV96706.1 phage protein [Bordetella trematum]